LGGTRARSPVSFARSGATGNRIVRIQWQNFGFKGDFIRNGSATDSGNLQLWIYENPQKIELRFGPAKIAHKNADFPTGIQVNCSFDDGGGGEDGLIVKGNPASPTTVVYTSTADDTLNNWPADGKYFSFDFTALGVKQTVKNKLEFYYHSNAIYLKNTAEKLTIYATDGRQIEQFMKPKDKVILNNLSSGVYTAVVEENGVNRQLRFVVP
jgi:hypothetical protein